MTDHIPIPPRSNPLSPIAQFMLNAAFHQHQQHDHLNPTPDNLQVPGPLSPDAKAVMDAFLDSAVDAGNYYATRSHQIAAALRAAAMRTLLTSEHYEGSTPNDYELGWNAAVAYIQNIATELEGQS